LGDWSREFGQIVGYTIIRRHHFHLVSVRMVFRGDFSIFNGRGLHCQLKYFYLVAFGLRNPSSVEEVLNSSLAIPSCSAVSTLRLLPSILKPSVVSFLSHG